MTAKARAEATVRAFRDGEGYSGNDEYLAGLIFEALESYAAEARNEALEEAADKIKLWKIASEIVLSLKSPRNEVTKPESGASSDDGGKVK